MAPRKRRKVVLSTKLQQKEGSEATAVAAVSSRQQSPSCHTVPAADSSEIVHLYSSYKGFVVLLAFDISL